jgi:hypothetical protein
LLWPEFQQAKLAVQLLRSARDVRETSTEACRLELVAAAQVQAIIRCLITALKKLAAAVLWFSTLLKACMGEVLRVPNGRALLLIPRSGSHSIAIAALKTFWPDKYEACAASDGYSHPAVYFPQYESFCGQDDLGIVVRDPVERFRSLCAHRPEMTVDEHLKNPCYGPLPQGSFTRHFRFEDGLDAVAEYLGLPVPMPQIDATRESDKPTLTSEQLQIVRQLFFVDIALWESLS